MDAKIFICLVSEKEIKRRLRERELCTPGELKNMFNSARCRMIHKVKGSPKIFNLQKNDSDCRL